MNKIPPVPETSPENSMETPKEAFEDLKVRLRTLSYTAAFVEAQKVQGLPPAQELELAALIEEVRLKESVMKADPKHEKQTPPVPLRSIAKVVCFVSAASSALLFIAYGMGWG